jgi:general secretion pathway protein D
MMKAALTPLCLTFLLGTVPILSAQTTPQETAVQAAIRRDADRITLRQKLLQAQDAQQRGDLVTAAKLYDACWALCEGIGPGVDAERTQTVNGLTAVRMQLARNAQRRGDLKDAQTQVEDVLRVDPRNPDAAAFSMENKQLLEAQRGRIPSLDAQERVPAIAEQKTKAATLVQNAKLFYDMRKLDEAEANLKEALKLDPSNQNAIYYYNLVSNERARQAAGSRTVDSEKKLVRVEEAWADSVKRETLPQPNPMARTNLIFTSLGRQAIMSKLDRIHLDTVFYDGLPLSEVIRSLSEEVKKRDPEKRGINILVNPNQETVSTTPVTGGIGGGPGAPNPLLGAPAAPAAPAIDPTTGLPVATAPTTEGPVDINSVTIRINPALTDVRLADVLEAIQTVADRPIKYSILDYAIVFSLKGPETAQLHIRTFHVNPNTFYQGLESVGGLDFASLVPTSTTGTGGGAGGVGGGGGGGGGGQGGQSGQNGGVLTIPRVTVSQATTTGGGGGGGGGGQNGQSGVGIFGVTRTNQMAVVQNAVIQFFATVGVDLSAVSGKSVFWNDREGSLMVRATSQELDIIEAAIQTLNVAPPEVNVKTKFVEITQNDTKALGFDWYLGNFLIGNKAAGLQGGSAPSFNNGNGGTFPGVVNTSPEGTLQDTTIAPTINDQLITSGLRNSAAAPAVATLTGILTDPQFRVVLRALEQRDGADLLNQSDVTTLSGRQAQIQVVDLKFVITGVASTTAVGGAGAGAGGAGAVVNNPAVQTFQPIPSPIPLGPTLDVIPYVSADGYTIQMSLIPTIVEFIGYDDPGQFAIISQGITAGGGTTPLSVPVPLPLFRIRQVTTSTIVWDGQTIVLGGLISDNITRFKDKVPVLGDLPFVGRLFRSESSQTQKKNLVIFVTPTIIDPAGNRVHTDEDLPFAQNAVPPQKAENP